MQPPGLQHQEDQPLVRLVAQQVGGEGHQVRSVAHAHPVRLVIDRHARSIGTGTPEQAAVHSALLDARPCGQHLRRAPE